jgi:hypothetical protein
VSVSSAVGDHPEIQEPAWVYVPESGRTINQHGRNLIH